MRWFDENQVHKVRKKNLARKKQLSTTGGWLVSGGKWQSEVEDNEEKAYPTEGRGCTQSYVVVFAS